MNFKPKLLAFDLDGTLAESKRPVTAEMGALLAALLTKMPVAVLSGASFDQIEQQFLPALPEGAQVKNLYLFPTNAAKCFVYKNNVWTEHYNHSFNAFERSRILQALKESLEETGFANDSGRPSAWGERIEDREAQITFSALGQKAPIEEKTKWDKGGEKRKPLCQALMKRIPDFEIRINATTSIDITKKGINKAYGVRQLVQLTNISIPEMLYVGDALREGGNDAIVKETGVKTEEVQGPADTAALITHILMQE